MSAIPGGVESPKVLKISCLVDAEEQLCEAQQEASGGVDENRIVDFGDYDYLTKEHTADVVNECVSREIGHSKGQTETDDQVGFAVEHQHSEGSPSVVLLNSPLRIDWFLAAFGRPCSKSSEQ